MPLTEFGFIQKTNISFLATGGDAAYSAHSTVGDQTGRRSARYDIGVTDALKRPRLYRWRAKFVNGASVGTLGRAIYLYLIAGNASTGTDADGSQAETDAALASSDARRNLVPMGVVVCDATAASSVYRASGYVWISARYIQVAHWNDLGVSISGTSGDHEIILTPVPDVSE